MNTFDNIIGYQSIKQELRRIADILKNREAYDRLGVTLPRGLLLHGVPGVGKSLMANVVMEESGRPTFVCRKNQPNGDFVKHIKETFDKAIENAPSIVFLDDMDKFANADANHPDAEEYVTVQSCIDEVKGKDVFVLATVNNIRNLPPSLRRTGRFDRTLEIHTPDSQDAPAIIAHYLKNKKVADDLDVEMIAHIMDGLSCAELETVINEAGVYAGFARESRITMKHILEACLRIVFNVQCGTTQTKETDLTDSLSDSSCIETQILYHEAGHAVVSEVLCPGSVTLVSAYGRRGRKGGFVDYYCDTPQVTLRWLRSRIISALGSKAAIEHQFGIADVGCEDDVYKAFHLARNLIVDKCVNGLHFYSDQDNNSEHQKSRQDQAVTAEIEWCYRKALEIVSLNHEFLNKVASELAQKKLLSAADIQRIKRECKTVAVAL